MVGWPSCLAILGAPPLVRVDLLNDTWIHAVAHLSTPSQPVEFVNIWKLISHTAVDPLTPDSISLRWTANGVYSSASAYSI